MSNVRPGGPAQCIYMYINISVSHVRCGCYRLVYVPYIIITVTTIITEGANRGVVIGARRDATGASRFPRIRARLVSRRRRRRLAASRRRRDAVFSFRVETVHALNNTATSDIGSEALLVLKLYFPSPGNTILLPSTLSTSTRGQGDSVACPGMYVTLAPSPHPYQNF